MIEAGGILSLFTWLSLWGLVVYQFLITSVILLNFSRLFLDPHGRVHRICGGLQQCWLLLGTVMAVLESSGYMTTGHSSWFAYNIALALAGTSSTLSAALYFPHRRVKNDSGQSGTLNEKAIVTYDEMIEHSFYQVLNLVQISYIQAMQLFETSWPDKLRTAPMRLFALFWATSPWFFRRSFPVHSFQSNWTLTEKHTKIETILYRLKKGQYIFYKHAVLHGLNISICLRPSLPLGLDFMIFWLCLNTSYVMEFFMQTMVKRKILSQYQHLWLQRWLMATSSLSAIGPVISQVAWPAVVLSVLLNFYNRYNDVANTMFLATCLILVYENGF